MTEKKKTIRQVVPMLEQLNPDSSSNRRGSSNENLVLILIQFLTIFDSNGLVLNHLGGDLNAITAKQCQRQNA